MNKTTTNPIYLQEQTANEYESHYETKYKRADKLEKELLKKLLEQFENAKNLLEVGCGTAHFTRWMETLGLECYGVDVSKPMLKEAKKRWSQGRLLQCEANNLPFRTKSADIVAFVTSLEFIRDVDAALVEAARVAKKGIVIGLMNKHSLSAFRKRLQVKTGSNQFYQEARFYSGSEIRKKLEANIKGYRIVCLQTTVFPKAFGDIESKRLPFGAFLGIAVKLEAAYD
jgi:ubiquinone/menaquinone biosynthesis C-methylase UbiE